MIINILKSPGNAFIYRDKPKKAGYVEKLKTGDILK